MNRLIDKRPIVLTKILINGQTDRQTDGQLDRHLDVKTVEQKNRWMDGQMFE